MAVFPPTQPFFNSQIHQVGYQGPDEENLKFEASATLIIRHLPDAIPPETLLRLFSHYGASSVRHCSSGRLKNCAFVDFKNEALASQAQRQLHGLRFLGKVLSVEKATKQEVQTTGGHVRKDITPSQPMSKETLTSTDNSQASKFRNLHCGEAIAPKLGIEYPFPPQLEYAYPPPDGNILTNIVNALIAVPRFYTQVLHLMNKMNIPAPFRIALPTPPLPPSAPVPSCPLPPVSVENPSVADLSSEESEMESSNEDAAGKPARKRLKRDSIVGPAVDKDVAHEAVGLRPSTLVPKEMPLIKKKNPMLQIKITQKFIHKEQNGEHIAETLEETDKEFPATKPYASAEDLQSGQLPLEEILSLPMFKNYSAGNPAPVLYVKNLSKDVVLDDFYFIFGSLFGDLELVKSSLTVKLMQEGRMRGQAFVTFPSTELAHQALNIANGYIFKGKPIIIQFGRNPAAAKNG